MPSKQHQQQQQERLDTLRSPACQRYFASDGSAHPATYDKLRAIFRPSAAGEALKVRRAWTYEDVVDPDSYERVRYPDREQFVLPVWTRTAQRAVKAFISPGGDFVAPAVWKSGTTTLNAALSRLTPYCRDAIHSGLNGASACVPTSQLHTRRPTSAEWPRRPQGKGHDGFCRQQRSRGALGCARIGTFAASERSLVFAFARDPVDRFVGTAMAALQKEASCPPPPTPAPRRGPVLLGLALGPCRIAWRLARSWGEASRSPRLLPAAGQQLQPQLVLRARLPAHDHPAALARGRAARERAAQAVEAAAARPLADAELLLVRHRLRRHAARRALPGQARDLPRRLRAAARAPLSGLEPQTSMHQRLESSAAHT